MPDRPQILGLRFNWGLRLDRLFRGLDVHRRKPRETCVHFILKFKGYATDWCLRGDTHPNSAAQAGVH